MVALILAGAAAGAWLLYRAGRGIQHSIPGSNDDIVFV